MNERIHIQVTQSGAKAVRRDIADLGSGAESATKGMAGLAGAIKGLVAAAAVREAVKLADAYTELTNRIRVVTRSEQEMSSVRSELFRVANQTRGSVESVSEVYSRLALTTKSLGMSQREVIQLTESLQQATILSGASSQEAAGALRQLAQGLGTGALRGEELNSVLENTPVVAQVIADHLKVNIGQLRQMGAEGKITGKNIVDAFKEARGELADRFGKTVPTVGQATTVLMNSLTKLVGEVNETTGATTGLVGVLIDLSKWLDENSQSIADLVKELTNISELKGALNDLLPSMDSDGITTLQFMTLMVSTLEDRLIGVVRAASKVWAALSFGLEEQPDGSIMQDFGDILTGQGDVTARVLETIKAQRASGRRGVTTVNDDPNDPRNMLDQKGPVTVTPPKEKGPTFASYLQDLERENELLRMNNDQREIEQALDQAKQSLKGKLNKQQEAILRHQIEENAVQVAINESIEERLKLEVEAIEAEKETQRTYHDILTDLREQRRLSFMTNEEREIAIGLIEAQAQAQGQLNEQQLRTIENELRRNQSLGIGQQERTEMPGDFNGAVDFMGDEMLTQMHTLGQEMAIIFGPGGTIHAGLQGIVGSLTDVIGQSIAFGRSWNDTQEAIKNVGRSILAEIISSLIRIPIQMTINEAIASGLRAKATAETVAQAGTTAAAMAPAAAATSLATAGANSVGASAAIIGVAALATGALVGAALFEDGGYTGSGSRSGVAGLVHGQEYVLNADATARYGRSQLDAMNSGTWNPSGGGSQVSVTIVDQTDGATRWETRKVDDQHIEVVARRVVQEMAPDVIARDLRDPQSKTGRALSSSYTAKRSRS